MKYYALFGRVSAEFHKWIFGIHNWYFEFEGVMNSMLRFSIFLCVFTLLSTNYTHADILSESIYERAFAHLETVKEHKKDQLTTYCMSIDSKAKQVKNDPVLLDFFLIKNKYYLLQHKTPPPEKTKQAIEKYKSNILRHYAENYMEFYDLLLINNKGDVIFTIKKEAEYHSNVFNGDMKDLPFASHLRPEPNDYYLDFTYYHPSDEPAAFFVEPIYRNNEFKGWFVLQWAVNKLSSLVSDFESLGKTGEIFLVNKDQYLLSDIRFIGDSTILMKHLSLDNIQYKFEKREGKIIVTDYRGFRVLSVFELFSFMGSEWLLIAKIDEDEILTDFFNQQKNDALLERIIKKSAWNDENSSFLMNHEKSKRVDIDEFVKADDGNNMVTRGVSTCTAVVACFQGRFAYMAHISPYDKMYGENRTDLLGHIIRRIKRYDIYSYEMRNIQFHVIATHHNSIHEIVTRLLAEGFLLSQIHFLYNPRAAVVDASFDYEQNMAMVVWMSDRERRNAGTQISSDKTNLGRILKEIALDQNTSLQ